MAAFHETTEGYRFFNGQLPTLIESIQNLHREVASLGGQLTIANTLKQRELALMERMAKEQFGIELEPDLPTPDCTHQVNEDCMLCRECGKCSENLDDVDRCPNCIPVQG